MPIPSAEWTNGAWSPKRAQFHQLGEMLGLKGSITPADLQDLFRKVASAKVFAESVQPFLEATGLTMLKVLERLEHIESRLCLLEPIPFRSLQGYANPTSFTGVAILPTGTTNWSKLRLGQIMLAMEAGAIFDRVVCLGSSRVTNAAADRRHHLVRNIPPGKELTERELLRQMVPPTSLYRFPELPEINDQGKPLSLEQQLKYLIASGQYDELIGKADIYVPSTPNSLYVPLHAMRVLGHNNVWFSQDGAHAVRNMPGWWWPSLQDTSTTPNGILRLWIELIHTGCMAP